MTNIPGVTPNDDHARLHAVVMRRIELLMYEAEVLEKLARYRRDLAELLLDNPRAILSDKGCQMVSNCEEQIAALDGAM